MGAVGQDSKWRPSLKIMWHHAKEALKLDCTWLVLCGALPCPQLTGRFELNDTFDGTLICMHNSFEDGSLEAILSVLWFRLALWQVAGNAATRHLGLCTFK